MFIVRDIFHLHFGHYKDVKKLLDQAKQQNLMAAHAQHRRVLTDFTGLSYRLILEEGYNSLADYEKGLSTELSAAAWQEWYAEFKKHVLASEREILKEV